MKNLKVYWENLLGKRSVALVLAVAISASLSACGKKSDCEISEDHVHKYINTSGYSRYIDKEYLKYEGYEWTDDYLYTNQDELDLRHFEDKKDLLRISENLDTIVAQQEANVDYTEYRYKYSTLIPIHVGKITTFTRATHYSWTKDPNHSGLTGEERLCHYMYQAYKIEVNEKGKKVLIPSEYVDDIRTVMDEYPYVKAKYAKVFNPELNCEADYEDGSEEELTVEERKSKIDHSYNSSSVDKTNKVMRLSFS